MFESNDQPERQNLSVVAITLLKGIVFRDGNEALWESLLSLQPRVRDYVATLNLDLIVDESEGYAFLRTRAEDGEDDAPKYPRLMVRRPLSFPVSLLVALLRKKLAEFDAVGQGSEGSMLVLTRDEMVEMIRVFLPQSSNEARLVEQIDSHINKVVDLGYLRRLKSSGNPSGFEVRRVLKAFVDAQWLAEFDARLVEYREQLEREDDNGADSQ